MPLPTLALLRGSCISVFFDKQGKYDHRKVMSFDASAPSLGQGAFLYTIKNGSQEVAEI